MIHSLYSLLYSLSMFSMKCTMATRTCSQFLQTRWGPQDLPSDTFLIPVTLHTVLVRLRFKSHATVFEQSLISKPQTNTSCFGFQLLHHHRKSPAPWEVINTPDEAEIRMFPCTCPIHNVRRLHTGSATILREHNHVTQVYTACNGNTRRVYMVHNVSPSYDGVRRRGERYESTERK